MKHLIAAMILISVSVCASAEQTKHAPLSRPQKDSLRNEIEVMDANDQKYRWMIMYGELDEQKINEIKKME